MALTWETYGTSNVAIQPNTIFYYKNMFYGSNGTNLYRSSDMLSWSSVVSNVQPVGQNDYYLYLGRTNTGTGLQIGVYDGSSVSWIGSSSSNKIDYGTTCSGSMMRVSYSGTTTYLIDGKTLRNTNSGNNSDPTYHIGTPKIIYNNGSYSSPSFNYFDGSSTSSTPFTGNGDRIASFKLGSKYYVIANRNQWESSDYVNWTPTSKIRSTSTIYHLVVEDSYNIVYIVGFDSDIQSFYSTDGMNTWTQDSRPGSTSGKVIFANGYLYTTYNSIVYRAQVQAPETSSIIRYGAEKVITTLPDFTQSTPSTSVIVFAQSPTLNLKKNTDYRLRFTAKTVSGYQGMDIDLWPDDLPQFNLMHDSTGITPEWKTFDFIFNSSSDNMLACSLRLFIDFPNSDGYTVPVGFSVKDIVFTEVSDIEFKECNPFYYNGSSFVECVAKYYNGSAWVDL